MTDTLPLSHSTNLARLGNAGDEVRFAADEATRAAIAAWSGVLSLQKLEVMVRIKKLDASRFGLDFTLDADVTQACVVTLEPLESDVEEAVDVLFAPVAGEGAQPETVNYDADPDDSKEPPEPLVDGTVDIGALATEFLVLGTDPHPRKAGAEFAPFKLGDDGAGAFSALEALKKRFGDGNA